MQMKGDDVGVSQDVHEAGAGGIVSWCLVLLCHFMSLSVEQSFERLVALSVLLS